jgi:hypothetical protein
MKDLVLAIIGTIGIAALAVSMNNEQNKPVREDFQFQMRRKSEKVTLNGMGGEDQVPIDQVPLIKCAKTGEPAKRSSIENYSHGRVVGNGLGARDSTNMPFINPTPHLNQTVNKPSPSLNLPSLLRYNAPSLSNMGVADDYQCNGSIRENYGVSKSSLPTESGDLEVALNYSAAPLKATPVNPQYPADNLAPAGVLDDFDGKEVMVFDRPMTTTLKVGRFARSGTRDLIRGDLPCAPNPHTGWFSTPADPTALSKGALQVMGGDSESTTTMNKFMEIYGDTTGVGSGVNLADVPDYQYTAYEMTNRADGVCKNTVSVTNF